MNKDRRRNIQSRKSKRVILVAYEGDNKTEKNYLNNFKGREKNYIIKPVPGNETDPVNLVKQTIVKVKELGLDLNEDDMAYCIFDTDINPEKNIQISNAINLAKEKKIIPIISSPCVELWFLLHYEFSTATISNDDVIDKLRKHYPKYQKNCDIYPEINDRVNKAILNAKKLENYQLQNNKQLQTVEANPYTEMYKIVEELQKINRELTLGFII